MNIKRKLRSVVFPLMVACALSACGGSSEPTASATDVPPTLTPFPTFAYVEPTHPPVFEQTGIEDSSEEDSESAGTILDPKLVERGLGRYKALECGNCHGANGEGTDLAPSLLDFDLSEDEFITFVRSGGDMGPRHQFSTDRLSNSGSRNLYQYLVSIAQSD